MSGAPDEYSLYRRLKLLGEGSFVQNSYIFFFLI